jgi:hypothetical protein
MVTIIDAFFLTTYPFLTKNIRIVEGMRMSHEEQKLKEADEKGPPGRSGTLPEHRRRVGTIRWDSQRKIDPSSLRCRGKKYPDERLPMNSLTISLVPSGSMFGGTLLATVLSKFLPDHHLSHASRDAVKLGIGMIAALAAPVLWVGCLRSRKSKPETMEKL